MNNIVKHGLLLAVLLVFTGLLFTVLNHAQSNSNAFNLGCIVAAAALTFCVHTLLKDEPNRGEGK